MTFEDWEASVPEDLRSDAVWRIEAYRLALFLADLSWEDSQRLLREPRAKAMVDQLFRSCGNISSSICEGYSRTTPAQRALFYGYALGSTREARDWYYKCRRAMRAEVVTHRLSVASSIIRLLLTMVRNERAAGRRAIPTE